MRASIMAVIALYASLAHGGCTEALEACDALVAAQDAQIHHLKEDVSKLQGALVECKRPLVPFFVMFVTSIATLGAGAVLSVPLLVVFGGGMGVGSIAVGMKE